jgi:hypothetical protein
VLLIGLDKDELAADVYPFAEVAGFLLAMDTGFGIGRVRLRTVGAIHSSS